MQITRSTAHTTQFHIFFLSFSVKKGRKRKDLQSWIDQLWNLLPSFCRYPVDVHHSFGSLSKLLVEILKCDECLYKSAVKALQQLVDGTRRLSSNNQDVEIYMELSALFTSKPIGFKCPRLERCSKKEARKDLKVLASHSANLLCTFADYFLESSPEKCAHLKVALRCLAQLSGSTNISELFVSLVKRFDLEDTQLESDSQECKTDEVDSKDEESTDTTDELNYRRSLLLDLISTFAEVADEDLLDKLFGFIKSCLLVFFICFCSFYPEDPIS
jgi:ribosomal RNA-processing protein 12